MENNILGIDIGGSGIKGSIIDISNGILLYERIRIETPPLATPNQIAEIVKEIANEFKYEGIIGCGFPAVVKDGVVKTAANISKKSININIKELLTNVTGRKTYVYNDADAAGYSEIEFGYGKDIPGTILFLTIGTGIGSALFVNGKLLPNTELGHLFMKNKKEAEKYTSDAVRQRQNLSWQAWSLRFDKFLQYVDFIFNPDLIIIGGGASKKFEKFKDFITIKTQVVPAKLLNNAGMIGAAMLAHKENKHN